MWVERWLQPAGESPLRTAYIEMVATAKAARNRGYPTRLLELLPPMLHDFQLAMELPRTPAGLGRERPLSVEWRPGEVW